MYRTLIEEVANFLNRLPDEIKLAFSSEVLMRTRNSEEQADYKWKHEHRQIYTLLNQNIGARNNMMNTRAISNVFSIGDIAKIIEATNPIVKLKKGERLTFG